MLELLRHVFGTVRVELEPYLRVELAKAGQDLRKNPRRVKTATANGNNATELVFLGKFFVNFLDEYFHLFGPPFQHEPCIRQLQMPPAYKQHRTQLLFQLGNLPAQGRLCHM